MTTTTSELLHPDPLLVTRAIDRRSFCTLATVSPGGVPHVAAVLYVRAGEALWVSTVRSSRKARNVAANGKAAVCIPVRRLPVGPPSSIQFQAAAQVVALDDAGLRALVGSGQLEAVTKHGELELPGGCFLRIALPRRIATFGLGLTLRRFLAEPLAAGGATELDL